MANLLTALQQGLFRRLGADKGNDRADRKDTDDCADQYCGRRALGGDPIVLRKDKDIASHGKGCRRDDDGGCERINWKQYNQTKCDKGRM